MTARIRLSVTAFILILIPALSGPALVAQEGSRGSYEFAVTVHTGYTTMSIPRTRDFLNNVSDFFRQAYGIRMETLVAFPNNWLVGSSIRLRLQQALWLDAGVYYTRSRGTLGYRDLHGRMNEDLHLQVFAPRLGLIMHLGDDERALPFVFAGVGAILSSLRIDEAVQFYQAPEYSGNSSTTLSGTMAALEGGVGLQIAAGPCALSFEAGYRVSLKDDEWQQDYSDNFNGWILGGRVCIPFRL
jgi:hypothetical protein